MYNNGHNTWNKLKEPCKFGPKQKILIAAFVYILTAIVNLGDWALDHIPPIFETFLKIFKIPKISLKS